MSFQALSLVSNFIGQNQNRPRIRFSCPERIERTIRRYLHGIYLMASDECATAVRFKSKFCQIRYKIKNQLRLDDIPLRNCIKSFLVIKGRCKITKCSQQPPPLPTCDSAVGRMQSLTHLEQTQVRCGGWGGCPFRRGRKIALGVSSFQHIQRGE